MPANQTNRVEEWNGVIVELQIGNWNHPPQTDHDEHVIDEQERHGEHSLQESVAQPQRVVHTQHRHEQRLRQIHNQEDGHDDDQHCGRGIAIGLALRLPIPLLHQQTAFALLCSD